jgi:micrococcal nuclease
MYVYKAKIVKVYDGDTVTAVVDLGFGITNKIKIRLYGIDTPEIRGDERPDGLVSRDRLRELILDKEVIIKTIKDRTGKYGRYLAEIYQWDGTQQNRISVNIMLITEGLAEKYIP